MVTFPARSQKKPPLPLGQRRSRHLFRGRFFPAPGCCLTLALLQLEDLHIFIVRRNRRKILHFQR